MEVNRPDIEWNLGLRWMLATILGYTVGWAMSLPIGWAVGGVVGGGITGAMVGGIVGITQWVVLRQRLSWAGWWVLASILGYAVGLSLANLVSNAVNTATGGDISLALGPAIVGATVGGTQWVLLQRQVASAGWWVPASVVGVVGGGLLGDISRALSLQVGFTFGFTIGFAIFGAVYGAITGIAMIWIIQKPKATNVRSVRRRSERRSSARGQ